MKEKNIYGKQGQVKSSPSREELGAEPAQWDENSHLPFFLYFSQQPDNHLLPDMRDLLSTHKKLTLPIYAALTVVHIQYTNSACLYGWTLETKLRHYMSFLHHSYCTYYENQPQDARNTII